jgi:hypothetical protein
MNKELNELITVGQHDKIFPLFSKADLAKRWGKSLQGVHWLAENQNNFPKPIEIFYSDSANNVYYPLCEVLRYEQERNSVE